MDERKLRLEKEEQERQAKKAAALARIQAQKEAEAKMTPEELAEYKQKQMEEAKELARQRKAAMLAKQQGTATNNEETDSEALKVKRLKESENKAIEIAKHHGSIKESILPKVQENLEQKIAKAQVEEENNLPHSLRKRAGLRDNVLSIKAYPEYVEREKDLSLVGLVPDDSRQNPEQKKVIPAVLLSAQEKKVENNVLPAALKRKTLRTKK